MLALALCLSLSVGCGMWGEEEKAPSREDYALEMNTDYPPCTKLPFGNGREAKVILLFGQSNASGCSIVEYLRLNTDPEEYARYEAGFPGVKINYAIDNQYATSGGEFLPVDLTCGCGDGFFGPEVGIADALDRAYPEEEVFLLKFTMSGYSLAHHWLYDGERAWIYDAALAFVKTYMDALLSNGYQARIEAIMWMQGESDVALNRAEGYYDNQVRFAAYLREDLKAYASGEIYFIDAGISDSPYCEPGYPIINEAKRRFAALSEYNLYFDTIAMGLTTLYEPDYDPDLGHYDSRSAIELGRRFGAVFISCMEREETAKVTEQSEDEV